MGGDPCRAVAVSLRYLPSAAGPVRPYVALGQVWCWDCEWWPCTADAVALIDQRARWGEQALCQQG